MDARDTLPSTATAADLALHRRDVAAELAQARQVQTSLLLAEPPAFP